MTDDQQDKTQAVAKMRAAPETRAAVTLSKFNSIDIHGVNVGITNTLSELRRQTDQLKNGDLGRVEEILLSQMNVLDELFNDLTVKAIRQEHMDYVTSFLQMAFQAQKQCRTTAETLAHLKQPKTVFAKQINVANQQQVNNNQNLRDKKPQNSKNSKNQKQQNELLSKNNEQLDTRETFKAIPGYSAMETVG